MFQQLAQRRTSQMPLPTTESSGAMTDASKRRIEMQSLRSTQSQIGWLEVVSWSPWGGTEDLATKALLPAGITNMAMWGRTKVRIWKV